MIFIDTETTGLMKPTATELAFQPYATEIYAVRLDDNFSFVSEVDTLVKPPVPIPEEIVRMTGITNEDVANAPPFIRIVNELVELFLGERTVVGHNINFDMGVVYCELTRSGLELHFPWPPVWICTMEKSMPLQHKRLKLRDLYELATGKPHEHAHRAKDDVVALVECFLWLRKQGLV